MTFIKFPSQIEPDRVTVTLQRTDEMFGSPVTGIQQVASRGNAFWKWTYEYKNISMEEREIVEAFLMKCRGSLNTFKVHDPANYQLRGSMSSWIDMYDGEGSFITTAGSWSSRANSYFSKTEKLDSHITDEHNLLLGWKKLGSVAALKWVLPGALTTSLEGGKAYVQRLKHFPAYNDKVAHGVTLRVSSGGGYDIAHGPGQANVQSEGQLTLPFVIGSDISTITIDTVEWTTADGVVGDYWHYADFRLAKCALVSNSENLIKHSNEFDESWGTIRGGVDSGYSDASPTGIESGAWNLYADSQVNTTHYIQQNITKIMTEDVYAFSVYAKAAEIDRLRLRMDDNSANHATNAIFDLAAEVSSLFTELGDYRNSSHTIKDVGSGWFRCSLSASVSSGATLRSLIYLSSGNSIAFTGNGADGLEIFGAQLRQHPFPGHYVPTVTDTIVGSAWQTGSKVFVEGFDPGDIIKAGTRIEVVNQFHNRSANIFERSEFKRITEEVRASLDGSAILPIDPPIRNAPVTARSYPVSDHKGQTMHNPVIFADPEMKGRLLGGTVQYIEKPLQLADVVFEVIEDLTE